MGTLERAVELVDRSRAAQGDAAAYVVHLPRRKKTYVGTGLRRHVRVDLDGVTVESEGKRERFALPADPVLALRDWIDPALPCFVLVGSDIRRRTRDATLPLIVAVQPESEAEFADPDPSPLQPHAVPEAPIAGWRTEPDDVFLERLAAAIAVLRQREYGKMIITRPYERPAVGRDPLALFAGFAASEPGAACSHYFRMGADFHSLGCSPENIFELEGDRLSFDVVAATRGVSPDPETDRRWLADLQSDPKERAEHLMAFARYEARIAQLAQPGSVHVDHKLAVLQLGKVRHLWSRLSGRLREDLDWAGLLAGSYPPLVSYPPELGPLADAETQPYRFYGGVVGRIAPAGAGSAFFLNLRAALIHGARMYTLGGVGVIAQSEPPKELLEVRNKLSGLMRAVAAWEAGLLA